MAKVVSALAESDATEVAATLDGIDLLPYITGEKAIASHEFIVCFRQAFVGWGVVEPEWRVRYG